MSSPHRTEQSPLDLLSSDRRTPAHQRGAPPHFRLHRHRHAHHHGSNGSRPRSSGAHVLFRDDRDGHCRSAPEHSCGSSGALKGRGPAFRQAPLPFLTGPRASPISTASPGSGRFADLARHSRSRSSFPTAGRPVAQECRPRHSHGRGIPKRTAPQGNANRGAGA